MRESTNGKRVVFVARDLAGWREWGGNERCDHALMRCGVDDAASAGRGCGRGDVARMRAWGDEDLNGSDIRRAWTCGVGTSARARECAYSAERAATGNSRSN